MDVTAEEIIGTYTRPSAATDLSPHSKRRITVNMNRRNRPLYRDPNDKMIGGVCSGLGHYFDIDTVLVRIGFVVVALIGGGGILAYALLWGILDPAPPDHHEEPSESATLEPATLENEDNTTPNIDDQVARRVVPTPVSEASKADET